MIDTDFSRKAAGQSNIALWLAFWAEAVRVPSYRKRCRELREHYNRIVAADIAELAMSRGIEVEAEKLALMLNALISGLWIETVLGAASVTESQKRGHEICLDLMRKFFPDDF